MKYAGTNNLIKKQSNNSMKTNNHGDNTRGISRPNTTGLEKMRRPTCLTDAWEKQKRNIGSYKHSNTQFLDPDNGARDDPRLLVRMTTGTRTRITRATTITNRSNNQRRSKVAGSNTDWNDQKNRASSQNQPEKTARNLCSKIENIAKAWKKR